MIIQCDSCQAKFKISDDKVGAKGVKVRCTKCKNVFVVKPPEAPAPAPEAAAPAPPVAEAPAPPTPEAEGDFGFGGEEAGAAPSGDFSFDGAGDFSSGDLGGAEVAPPAAPPAPEAAPTPEAPAPEAPTEAPAPGGFDFSGAEEEAPETTAPGTFDFGGAPEAPAEEAPAPEAAAPGGFDFSGAEEVPPAPEAPAPEAPATEAPAEAATPGGFDFGFGGGEETSPSEGVGEETPGGFDFGFSQEEPAEAGAPEETSEADKTVMFSVDSEGGAEATIFAPPPSAEGGVAEDESEKTLFVPPGGEMPDAEATLTEEPSLSLGDEEEEEEEKDAKGKKKKKKKKKKAKKVKAPKEGGPEKKKANLAIALLFLLVFGGGTVAYYNDMLDIDAINEGVGEVVDIVIDKISGEEALPPAPELSIEKLKGTYLQNSHVGLIYVVDGEIKNTSSEPQMVRGVRGVLLKRNGEVIDARIVAASIMLSSTELTGLTIEDIDTRLTEDFVPDVPPRGSIPFMLVFMDVPADVGEAEIEVIP